MNKKVLAFGASNSSTSINKQLANYAANQLNNITISLLDLNDFEMPIYSIDREKENGIPDLAIKFKEQIADSDGIIISFAEHNGAYSAAFKNIYDWISRIEKVVWNNKPMFLMATSPGGRGGQTVLGIASAKFRFGNESTIAEFSLPSFMQNFDTEKGITNPDLKQNFNEQLAIFKNAL